MPSKNDTLREKIVLARENQEILNEMISRSHSLDSDQILSNMSDYARVYTRTVPVHGSEGWIYLEECVSDLVDNENLDGIDNGDRTRGVEMGETEGLMTIGDEFVSVLAKTLSDFPTRNIPRENVYIYNAELGELVEVKDADWVDGDICSI